MLGDEWNEKAQYETVRQIHGEMYKWKPYPPLGLEDDPDYLVGHWSMIQLTELQSVVQNKPNDDL